MKRLDEFGREIPDSRPLEIPAGFRRPPTLAEQIQRMVRTELSQRASEQGFETFEEAEDFDVGDEDDPHTPYEEVFDPVLGRSVTPDEFRRNEARYREEAIRRSQEEFKQYDLEEQLRRGSKAPEGPPRPSGEPSEPPAEVSS